MRGPDDLNDDERARIRYQVLSSLRGRETTLGDRVYDVVAFAALPAPHIVRALAIATILVGIVATATVASADSLPDDALYGMKLAGEQMRLALALSPEDRAAVELSMAEHRLKEAERLALDGRTSDALVATSSYGEHLATAAAALATIERLDPTAGPVVDRLRQRLVEQQRRAGDIATHLASDPGSLTAPVFRTIASGAPLSAGGLPLSAQIAEHAAAVTEHIATEAQRIARGGQPSVAPPPVDPSRSPAARTPAPTRAPTGTEASRPAGATAPARTPRAVETAAPRPTPHESATPTADPRALEAAEKARRDAEKARDAADRASGSAKKTASPSPTSRR